MAVAAPVVSAPQFTSFDRCDRCGSQAKVRASFATGVLLFCGHHGSVHYPTIADQASAVEDDGGLLVPKKFLTTTK